MTELSDYQRIIEKPRTERMQGQINALAANCDRLRKGIQDFIDGNYPNPRKERPGQCSHGIYYYDECGQCNDDYFVKLLSANAEGGDHDQR